MRHSERSEESIFETITNVEFWVLNAKNKNSPQRREDAKYSKSGRHF
jgi:hypothetical protein